MHIRRLLPFSTILVAVQTIQPYTSTPIGDTTLWWIIDVAILLLFALGANGNHIRANSIPKRFIKLYIYYNIFSIVRGFFIAETYWDWKGLVGNAMALLLPIVALLAMNASTSQRVLRGYIFITLPLFALFIGSTTTDAFGFYLIPISLLLVFFPLLTYTWRTFLFAIALFVFLVDIGARSNIIKFLFPFGLLFLYYLGFFKSKILAGFLQKLLFITPIILLILGLTGSFNIFKMGENVDGEYIERRVDTAGEVVEDDVKADTRTFLYEEVLASAKKNNSWWLGRSPARGNETSYFRDNVYIGGREERLANEVAMLNIFTWTGILGCFLYFICFFKSSGLAIRATNNTFSRMIGVQVAFHWFYSWFENVNYFTLNTLLIWFMVGLAASTEFRSMTDHEIKSWIRGVFRWRIPPFKYSSISST